MDGSHDHRMGVLRIVATPIGNLGDITDRARESLGSAHAVFCEDTRVTGRLLSALGIAHAGRLERLDENLLARDGAQAVLDVLRSGRDVAYCSDAGMPGISDPGQRLVSAARQEGFEVEVLPGASAVPCALASSGIEANAHFFGGFLPRKEGERRDLLRGLSRLDAALVLYESPKRLVPSLRTIAEELPSRKVAVCRELTKLHEEVVLGEAPEVLRELEARDAVKGEIAIVIGPPTHAEATAADDERTAKARRVARALVREGVSKRAIREILQDACDIPRNPAYDIVETMAGMADEEALGGIPCEDADGFVQAPSAEAHRLEAQGATP